MISIPEKDYRITFVRSSGAGGQNVNKVNTKAVLEFNVASSSLSDFQKARVNQVLKDRITQEGNIVLTAQSERTQSRNKDEVIKKLHQVIELSLYIPKYRKKTKKSKGVRSREKDSRIIQQRKKQSRKISTKE